MEQAVGDDDDWTRQLSEALGALGLRDDAARKALLDDVRAALYEALDDVLPAAGQEPNDPGAETGPVVRVLRGGRAGDSTPREGGPPQLRVLGGAGRGAAADGLSVGWIRLSGTSPEVAQTLAHGTRPAAYRVHCDAGELLVLADDTPVARVEEGQSVDVEATVLRARATHGGDARGRFVRLLP